MTRMYRPELHPVTFAGGSTGDWKIESVRAVTGDALPLVDRLDVRVDVDAAGDGEVRGFFEAWPDTSATSSEPSTIA